MAIRIVEFFGYAPYDYSPAAHEVRKNRYCPFLSTTCKKTLSDGEISGACTIRQVKVTDPIICCPIRLYDHNYKILLDVAAAVFGEGVKFVEPHEINKLDPAFKNVVVFGKGKVKELKLPKTASGRGGFFVDWILALLTPKGHLQEFVAVEVQSIDTTGNYRAERDAYLAEREFEGYSAAGVNWENVSKRILPQIIYKGHALRREQKCKGGLFFVCPAPIYKSIQQRLGSNLLEYPTQHPGSITFLWYDLGPEVPHGKRRQLQYGGKFTTTVDQVAVAFTAPVNLPEPNVYEAAIEAELVKARIGG